ncbi:MAG: methionyl-tRNA formyltransferase [Vicingaceae bacterium]
MKKELRIVFLGTPDFAVESLRAIHESGRKVVGVITSPDRQAGRGRKVQQSAVKKYAVEAGLPMLQPTNLKDPDFQEELKALKADLQIVVAFRMLPEAVWNMPPLGTFNLHASLLPQYRGAAPINWAIINGEKKSGVTTFFLQHKIDTGDILFQEEVELDDKETAGSLHNKLMEVGAKLVIKTLNAIEHGDYQEKPQNDLIAKGTTIAEAPKIFRQDCQINWNLEADVVDRLIRGLAPYPAAWTKIKHQEDDKVLNLKVYQIEIKSSTLALKAGELNVQDGEILVGTAIQTVSFTDLQLEGKKRMKAKELLNGFDFSNYQIIQS